MHRHPDACLRARVCSAVDNTWDAEVERYSLAPLCPQAGQREQVGTPA